MNKTELIAATAEKAGISKKSIEIPASKLPSFKASKALKDTVSK